ncbi:metallophosphoesterase family protein [Thalassoglobus polymorphus]|uniref:Calcineurin-like phosphoesterase superfamily domain protein n=1 Tax=Thalassoglobus polymorphus TaxID=2527994 RepID=A0A517QRE5_9PLAN|nr:metallophosphoesterase family protein [Thalassoglobus polymorphus]QDT34178.1 Calcineurin-like phosphoesterase superfamily domain protein [Thalassoglobus polymorphus]
MKLAFFGGIYNNYLALEEAIRDARARGAEQLFCLGDLGAFGPHPDRVFPLLYENNIQVVQGNYDNSIGNDFKDCQCGYTDPRDNYFAQISYEYTYQNTSRLNREWMRQLPAEIRFEIGGQRLLLCHGSPRKTNEFLWESTTSTHFLEKLADDHQAEILLGTHTGLHWERELSQGRRFINVGVLGRPENDGTTNVWYTLLTLSGSQCQVEFIPIEYDHLRLAREMKDESLPDEFIETILTGWWTTCLEVLPGRERRVGQF